MPWNREPFIFANSLPPNTVHKNCTCEWEHLEDIRPLERNSSLYCLPFSCMEILVVMLQVYSVEIHSIVSASGHAQEVGHSCRYPTVTACTILN